jgi:hypothetical protein
MKQAISLACDILLAIGLRSNALFPARGRGDIFSLDILSHRMGVAGGIAGQGQSAI